jgi:hypothetical protein
MSFNYSINQTQNLKILQNYITIITPSLQPTKKRTNILTFAALYSPSQFYGCNLRKIFHSGAYEQAYRTVVDHHYLEALPSTTTKQQRRGTESII